MLLGLAVSGTGGPAQAAFSEVKGVPELPDSVQKPHFRRGDADVNGEVQLTDAVAVLGYLFLGQQTVRCHDAGDADDNGREEISDAIRILGYLFLGTAPPAAPGPAACGPDEANEDPDLGCESSC